MKFDLKNILIGIIIGIISTTSMILLIGDVNIQTDFQFGEKSDKDIKRITPKVDEINLKFNEVRNWGDLIYKINENYWLPILDNEIRRIKVN